MCKQVVAGLRCKKSKTEFLLRSLMGHRWTREELFTNEAAARPEANVILSQMTAMLQHSSSVGARCTQLLFSRIVSPLQHPGAGNGL